MLREDVPVIGPSHRLHNSGTLPAPVVCRREQFCPLGGAVDGSRGAQNPLVVEVVVSTGLRFGTRTGYWCGRGQSSAREVGSGLLSSLRGGD
jgi:hypothetical protein